MMPRPRCASSGRGASGGSAGRRGSGRGRRAGRAAAGSGLCAAAFAEATPSTRRSRGIAEAARRERRRVRDGPGRRSGGRPGRAGDRAGGGGRRRGHVRVCRMPSAARGPGARRPGRRRGRLRTRRCASNLLDLMQLALTVRAPVPVSASAARRRACHEILHGEGVRVLATALAWCVLDEDMSKGGSQGRRHGPRLRARGPPDDPGGADATKVPGTRRRRRPRSSASACARSCSTSGRSGRCCPCARAASTPCCAPVVLRVSPRTGACPAADALEPPVVLYLVERDPDAQELDLQVAPCLECAPRRRGARARERGDEGVDLPAEGRRAVARGARGNAGKQTTRSSPRRREPPSTWSTQPTRCAPCSSSSCTVPPEADAAPRGGPRAGAVRRRPGRVRAAGRDRRGGPVLEGGVVVRGGGVFLISFVRLSSASPARYPLSLPLPTRTPQTCP